MKLTRVLLSLSFIFSLYGCVSPSQNSAETTTRTTSSALDPEALHETEFLNLINNNNATQYEQIRNSIDKLFVIYIKANENIATFQNELTTAIENQKNNPASHFDPMQTEAYKKLVKMWILSEQYSHDIAYFYQKSLELKTSDKVDATTKEKASIIYNVITKQMKTLQGAQRAELQKLLIELKDIYGKSITQHKKRLREKNVSLKDISSIPNNPEFSSLIYSDLNAAAAISKSLDMNKLEVQNSKFRKIGDEIESELSDIPDPIFSGRTPQSEIQDLTCTDGKKLCSSTGENGNIIGSVFPSGLWAFTYDDGPKAQTTNDLMNLFINYKDKINKRGEATFFWQAQNVLEHDDMVKKAIDNGFPIQNHSYSHANLAKLDTAGRQYQVLTSNEVITKAARKYDPNYKIQYFRCPYGACYAPKIPEVRQMIAKQGQLHAYWMIDSLDWKLMEKNQISKLVIDQMKLKNRGVILMHDVHVPTVEATKIILDWIKKQNDAGQTQYRLVTLPEAVDIVNGVKK